MATSVEELDATVRAFYESRGDIVRALIHLRYTKLIRRPTAKTGTKCHESGTFPSLEFYGFAPDEYSSKRTRTHGSWWTKFCRRPRTHKPNVSPQILARKQQLLTVLDLGLQVLDSVIMTRWKVLPREQCQGEECFVLLHTELTSQGSATLSSTSSSRLRTRRKASRVKGPFSTNSTSSSYPSSSKSGRTTGRYSSAKSSRHATRTYPSARIIWLFCGFYRRRFSISPRSK